MNTLIEKNKKNLLIIVFLIFMFSDYLGDKINQIFCYTDEIILCTMILYYFYNKIKRHKNIQLNNEEEKIIYTFIIIYFSGILGNILSGYQSNIIAIIKDMIINMKFFIPYILMIDIIKNENSSNMKNKITNIAKLAIIVASLIEILNLLCGFMGSIKYGKFGIPALTFGGHPYFSSAIIACATSLLTMDIKKNKQYIIIGLLLSALTFRTKAYLYIALIIFSIIFFRKTIKLWKIIIIFLIMLIIGWNKIEYYFLDPTASRSIMLSTSINIAQKYFPTGSGFATFGSTASGEYYSDAYKIYNLSNRYGFSKTNYSFVTDGGWAGIIGQFGIVGIIGYMYLLYIMIKKIFKDVKYRIPLIGIFGYLLISSTNENAFTSNYTILYAIVIAILTNIILRERSEKIEEEV